MNVNNVTMARPTKNNAILDRPTQKPFKGLVLNAEQMGKVNDMLDYEYYFRHIFFAGNRAFNDNKVTTFISRFRALAMAYDMGGITELLTPLMTHEQRKDIEQHIHFVHSLRWNGAPILRNITR